MPVAKPKAYSYIRFSTPEQARGTCCGGRRQQQRHGAPRVGLNWMTAFETSGSVHIMAQTAPQAL